MKKSIRNLFLFTAVVITAVVYFAFEAGALTEGKYTYTVSNDEASITAVDSSIGGDVIIPDILGGYPVTSIGNYAFENCKNLTSITIPGSVTSIGDSAFSRCSGLTSITIPDSVTSIGSYAFSNCEYLASATIPKSVTSIGEGVFDCYILCYSGSYAVEYAKDYGLPVVLLDSDVDEIIVSGKVGKLKWSFNKRTGIMKITGNGSMIDFSSVSAPWHDLRYLKKITVCSGVTGIGHSAFKDLDVKDVTISDSVTSIDDWAFYHCTSLESVTIPDSVTSIGAYAFDYCESLGNIIIGNSVISIGYSAFSDCKNLTSITIPESVTSIGDWAFGYCESLENVYASDIESWVGIEFEGSYSNPMWYAENLYFGNELAKDVVIPDSVTSIGSEAFVSCESLESITIPDSVTSIDDLAFYDCKSLESVIIGNGVTSIGTYAFRNCISLESVTIGNSVKTIGYYAFDDCTSLKEIIIFSTDCSFKGYNNNCGFNYTQTIYGFKGSTAEAFAEEIGAKFIDVETIHKHSYKTTTTKATLTSNGKTEIKCPVCGKVKSTQTIAKISSVTLSATKYIHDGNNKTPTVTVKDANGKKLVKNTDYKLSVASKRSGIGKYTVKVTFIGKYSGTKNVYFTILPGKPASVKSAALTTSSVKLTWSKVSGAAGYTVYRYSPSKKAYVKAGITTGTSLTVKKLYDGTKYTFKVVAYGKTSGGKVYNSEGYTLLKTATKTKTPAISKIATTKGKAVLTHTNVSGETGYTVYYSTSKTSGFKKYNNFKADTTTCNITKLTSGRTYYFKVRTYIKTDSGYVYSPWSAVKGIKVK